MTANEVVDAAYNLVINNGLTSNLNYALAAWGNSPGAFIANLNIYGSTTVSQYIGANPGTVAIAQAPGNNIYIDASLVNGLSAQEQTALVLHELLHNVTGSNDATIQQALGLSTAAPSVNISNKLAGAVVPVNYKKATFGIALLAMPGPGFLGLAPGQSETESRVQIRVTSAYGDDVQPYRIEITGGARPIDAAGEQDHRVAVRLVHDRSVVRVRSTKSRLLMREPSQVAMAMKLANAAQHGCSSAATPAA